jgi:hypothetical protein
LQILPNVDESTFKHELRMTRYSFQQVLNKIRNNSVFTEHQIPIDVQLAITLSRFGEYGTGSSWLKKASKFGIGEGTVQLCTSRVIKVSQILSLNCAELSPSNIIIHFFLSGTARFER